MLDTATDEQLLAQIAQASERSFEAFYDRHAGAVYGLARKILRTVADAEEVTQDVFVRVWRKAGEFDPKRGAALTWLMTVAHHAAVDVFRRNRNRQTDELDDATINAVAVARAQTDATLDRIAAAKALASLEDRDRSMLEALYFEGLSQTQLAARTGIPLGTIKTRARNALQRLRSHYEGPP